MERSQRDARTFATLRALPDLNPFVERRLVRLSLLCEKLRIRCLAVRRPAAAPAVAAADSRCAVGSAPRTRRPQGRCGASPLRREAGLRARQPNLFGDNAVNTSSSAERRPEPERRTRSATSANASRPATGRFAPQKRPTLQHDAAARRSRSADVSGQRRGQPQALRGPFWLRGDGGEEAEDAEDEDGDATVSGAPEKPNGVAVLATAAATAAIRRAGNDKEWQPLQPPAARANDSEGRRPP